MVKIFFWWNIAILCYFFLFWFIDALTNQSKWNSRQLSIIKKWFCLFIENVTINISLYQALTPQNFRVKNYYTSPTMSSQSTLSLQQNIVISLNCDQLEISLMPTMNKHVFMIQMIKIVKIFQQVPMPQHVSWQV